MNVSVKTKLDSREARRHAWQSAAVLVAILMIALAQYFLIPLLLPTGAAVDVLAILLCALSTPLHWGLMHESIHGNLFGDTRGNRVAGRILGSFLFLSWDVMRFGHLLHHSANRHVFDRPEAIPDGSTRLAAAGPYFAKLFGGHALISALTPFAILLPFSLQKHVLKTAAAGDEAKPFRVFVLRALSDPARRLRIRVDVAINIALVALAVWCWGAHWPVFVACLAARFCVLSFLDNAPHYGTPVDSGVKARNSHLPRFASWLVLDQNFHGVHHGFPALRWQELRSAFERSEIPYDSRWVATVLRQLRGPLVVPRSTR
ncbi:MAG TPA: fatty acid desaturase [Rhizomicrobium sp.]